jgi:hypothetical protein
VSPQPPPILVSVAAAVLVGALTIVGGTTDSIDVGNYAWASVFFVALAGIGAGAFAALFVPDERARGWTLVAVNVLVGLVSAGVFVYITLGA